MARHSRHRSVDDYPPYDEPRGSAGPLDPYPPRQGERDVDPYRRRSEAAYHDDRWAPRDRDEERYRRRQPAMSREPPISRERPISREPPLSRDLRSQRQPRGASEMRPIPRSYDHSPEPLSRSRRGRSEAPSRPVVHDAPRPRSRDTHARRGSDIPAEWGYGGHPQPRDPPPRDVDPRRSRGYSQDPEASRVPEGRYPPRSADTRRGRYHPGSGSGASPTFVRWQNPDEEDDPRFSRPNRAQTQPLHHPSRGSPPPRGRTRNYSPPSPAPRPRSRSTGQPLSRARSVPASRQAAPPPRSSRSQDRGRSRSRGGGDKTKSRAEKVAHYAAVGAAARVALQAGAQAAYKLRNDPSPWVGEKGVRVASAALGAGIVDGIVGNKHSKMRKGGMRHQAMREATQFGLRQFVVQPVATGALRSRSHKR